MGAFTGFCSRNLGFAIGRCEGKDGLQRLLH